MKGLFWSILVIAATSLYSLPTLGQDTTNHVKKKKLITVIDTLLIDKDLSHWSVRAVASYKDNKFSLKNNNATLQYTPNNRFGIGIGVATSKLIADLVLNIKTQTEEQTERFDFQGNVRIKQNVLLLQIQNYKGYNVTSSENSDPPLFRKDIRSFLSSITFMHMFNSNIKTLSSIYTGVLRDYKTAGSFLAGGYTSYRIIQGDSSIVPETSRVLFNDEAYIEQFQEFSLGIVGGYSHFFALPKNFFLLLALTPGFGLNYKRIETETQSYSPKELWEIHLYANISVGYNARKFYVEISDENQWNYNSLSNGNSGLINTTNFKIAFGWKIRSDNN